MKIVGVTGAAGTGKTTVLGEVTTEIKDRGFRTALCAPTGRAAQRIMENSGHYAMTIHRMLRISMPADDDEAGLPAYNKFNKMPYDVILVDEASMVSTDLYRNIIDAMKPGSAIRFFGDANQLPPVEGDSPFLRLLDKFPSIILEENFRSQDGVIAASQQVLNGLLPTGNEQFSVISNTGMTYKTITDFVDESFATTDSQIIIPIKGGRFGTIAVNNYVQQLLNKHPRKMEVRFSKRDEGTKSVWMRPGDKIIWTKNDYRLRLFNGQIGYVVDFDTEEGTIVVNFDGKDKVIPPVLESYDHTGRALFSYDPRRYIDLAYAITTHKAQGSEFKNVIMVLNRSRVLSRANFYTGITRAKRTVTVLAGPGGLQCAMRKHSATG